MEKSILAEVEWNFQGDDKNPDWVYCKRYASFVHQDACEFILYIGNDPAIDDEDKYWRSVVEGMKKAGCTQGFIQAYLDAKDANACRVMFWS